MLQGDSNKSNHVISLHLYFSWGKEKKSITYVVLELGTNAVLELLIRTKLHSVSLFGPISIIMSYQIKQALYSQN